MLSGQEYTKLNQESTTKNQQIYVKIYVQESLTWNKSNISMKWFKERERVEPEESSWIEEAMTYEQL